MVYLLYQYQNIQISPLEKGRLHTHTHTLSLSLSLSLSPPLSLSLFFLSSERKSAVTTTTTTNQALKQYMQYMQYNTIHSTLLYFLNQQATALIHNLLIRNKKALNHIYISIHMHYLATSTHFTCKLFLLRCSCYPQILA